MAVAGAVLGGIDCAIYAGGSLILIAFGLAVATHAVPSASPPSDVPTGLVLVGLGVLCGLPAALRIWWVDSALRSGDANIAEVIEAEVGPARIYGTPWGEPMMRRGLPIAARGTYQMTDNGEIGRYYMQQLWAARLRPGDRIWVLRRAGAGVLYAPVS